MASIFDSKPRPHSNLRFLNLIILIIFCLIQVSSQTSYRLRDTKIETQPNEVQYPEATITLRVKPLSGIPKGGVVELVLPARKIVEFNSDVLNPEVFKTC